MLVLPAAKRANEDYVKAGLRRPLPVKVPRTHEQRSLIMAEESTEFESIASEEDVSIVSDRSERYDPNATEDSTPVAKKPLKSALKTQQQPTPQVDQSDDYGYDEFPDDFENESVSSKGSSRRGALQQQHQQQQPAPASSLPSLPSLPSQALHAEVMLDEISREVVRLRNQQRLVLQERRQVAKDKKARADQRRVEYAAELRRHGQAAAAAEAENREAQERAREAEKRLAAVDKSRLLLAETNRTYEGELASLQSRLASATAEAEGTRQQLTVARAAHEAAQREWLQERAALGVEAKKSEMLLEVVRRGIEQSEARVQEERMALPAHQQRVHEEQLERVARIEASLRDKEHALAAEEARRLASLEHLKKDSLDQLSRHRLRTEADLAAERAELVKQRAALDLASTQWSATRAHESTAMESARATLHRQERELDEGRAQLQQQRSELEAAQRATEPNARAAERDRADARAIKAQADRVLFSAEEHASAILAAERGLMRREQAVVAAEKGLEVARARLTEERRTLLAEAAQQRSAQQALDTERFRLHQCSVELSSQLALVKRGIGQLTRGGDRFALRDGAGAEAEASNAMVAIDDSFSYQQQQAPPQQQQQQQQQQQKQEQEQDRPQYPAALDPALIHTALSLQDVGRSLKAVAAATTAQDPGLELLLGPRSFGRESPSFADLVGARSPPRRDPHAYSQHPEVERKEERSSFDELRSSQAKARTSDETAIASVRSSVQTSQQTIGALRGFASKYGVK